MFDTLISTIVENVFYSLAEASGLRDWLGDPLAHDAPKLAFRLALTQALSDVAATYPTRSLQSFAESLRDSAAPILARTLQPTTPFPTAAELTEFWLNHLNATSVIHTRAEFEGFAQRLLERLAIHLANHRMAETAQLSATAIADLRAEVAASLDRLQTSLGARINIANDAEINNSTITVGNITGRDQITINNYFVAGLPRLVVDYSSRIQEFLLEYLGSRGRGIQLTELDVWLDDPVAPPYYLMSAEAGRGKSALVCRWLARLTSRPDLALVFLPISIRFETATQDVVFAALAARLAAVFGEKMKASPTSLPLSAEEWKGVCQSYLRRVPSDGKRLLLILDGLDEAADWTAGRNLFPGDPPDGLRIVVTARLRPGEANAQGWATTLGWQSPKLARTATLPPLDRQGVEEALVSMGNPLDKLATQVDVVGELHRLSEGDPLLVRLYVDELLNQGERVKHLKAEELGTIQPGLAGYFERWWQDQQEQWRRQQRDPIRQEQSLRLLLNAIAAALGPLTHDDLAALHPDLGDGLLLKRLTQDVSRWLVGDGKGRGYSYSHPRLGYFFWEQLSRKEQAEWDRQFCGWGAETLAALNAGTLDLKQAPEYLLRHYANHLERSHAPAEAFYALVSNGWRLAWEWVDVSYGGFLGDVEWVWEKAKLGYDPAKPGKAAALAQQIKAALCKASVIAIGSDMPPELLVRAIQTGLWTPMQALAVAKLLINEEQVGKILISLIPHLPASLLTEAFNLAYLIKDEFTRINVLTAFAPLIPEIQAELEALHSSQLIKHKRSQIRATTTFASHLSERKRAAMLRVTQSLTSKEHQATTNTLNLAKDRHSDPLTEILADVLSLKNKIALVPLAPHLSQELLAEVLIGIRSINSKYDRSRALAILVQYLPQALLSKAILIAQLIDDEWSKIQTLVSLASYLSEIILLKLLELLRNKDFPVIHYSSFTKHGNDRSSLWITVASHLTGSIRTNLCAEALTAARSHSIEEFRANAFVDLAPLLPPEQHDKVMSEALTSARSILSDDFRAVALIRLIPYLTDKQRQGVINEAFTVVRALEDEYLRADALSRLASYLPTPLLGVALSDIRSFKDVRYYIDALGRLAPYLPTNLLSEALTAALSIKAKEYRIDALRCLAPHLSIEQRQTVLEEVIETNGYATLVRFAPYLTTALLDEALSYALSIRDKESRVSTLLRLAPYFPAEQRQNLLNVALTTARLIEREASRADALSRIASHLSAGQRQSVLSEALTATRSLKYKAASALSSLAEPLAHCPQEASSTAYCLWIETLPILASRPRPEFLQDLTALMPFILALAGDEAPQAAEGIYHAIQEVCGWWP